MIKPKTINVEIDYIHLLLLLNFNVSFHTGAILAANKPLWQKALENR